MVDDDPAILKISKTLLQRMNPAFQIAFAYSSHETLQFLERKSIDALVVDYALPDMNGLALLRLLRNRGEQLPFVMFTGRGHEQVAIDALNYGADYYLKKGGDPEMLFGELALVLDRIIENRRIKDQLAITYDALEHSLNAVVISDLENRIRYVNKAFLELFGICSNEEVLGTTQVEEWLQNAKANAKPGQIMEYTFSQPDGTLVCLKTLTSAVRNEEGVIAGTITAFIDITDQKISQNLINGIVSFSSGIRRATSPGNSP
jgi:PAS domain S-box-containing protein